jgi:hypothetical protein
MIFILHIEEGFAKRFRLCFSIAAYPLFFPYGFEISYGLPFFLWRLWIALIRLLMGDTEVFKEYNGWSVRLR